ncbi:hypothetical protein E1292_02530 [Nonomuraea deserti]|uniref:Uncharacterized protein n=1 Tax=Nonomuraea deserti TaxID=1848322 RepID=A0A4R4WFR4_9ACTN|nr:hypothetical protein [Nonomuraea deserti]TDD12330.1 hypothetical protein E1292_02530 [Nonomuraea deserti]
MRTAIFGGALMLAGTLAGAGAMDTAHAGADVGTAPAAQPDDRASKAGARIPCYDIRVNDVGFYRSVTIKSKCGQTNEVRARIASWPDGPCWTIEPGERRTHYYRSPGTFYNLKAC